MKKLVLFASGSGSNAENIIKHFKESALAQVVAVFSNKADSGVVERAATHDIPVVVFTKEELYGGHVLQQLEAIAPDLVVLAGFLLKFPPDLTLHYAGKIINIHPALLPKYGGKGMYGINVHRAILANREVETGISIHYVNEHYDEGNIIFQQTVAIGGCVTPEEIAFKVQQLEHEHFPLVIEQLLQS